MRLKIVLWTILAMVFVSIMPLSACATQEVKGVLQEINPNGEISILTPDGKVVTAQSDSNTVYTNNSKRCSPTELPPGSMVSLVIRDNRAESVREYDDDDRESDDDEDREYEDDDDDEEGTTPRPTSTVDGRQLYASYCARCHNSTPPSSWRTRRTATQLTSAINSGPGSMPAYSNILTTAQVTAIVQYIQGTASPLPTTIPAADGAQIYASSCAGCHGANRTGGRGPNITQSALSNRSVSNLTSFTSGHNTGRNLTSAQVTALSNWLKGVTPTTPTATPPPTTPPPTTPAATTPAALDGAQIYASNCAGCHGANRMGGSGPNITQSALSNRSVTNLTSFISGHRTGSSLTSSQVAALANWLKGVTPTTPPTTPPPTTSPPTTPAALDGAQIYASSCAGCHGANRTGGSGPNITQSALSNRSVTNLNNFISGHRTGSGLTSAQVAALANWLKTTP